MHQHKATDTKRSSLSTSSPNAEDIKIAHSFAQNISRKGQNYTMSLSQSEKTVHDYSRKSIKNSQTEYTTPKRGDKTSNIT